MKSQRHNAYISREEQATFELGIEARNEGRPKRPPLKLGTCLEHWWLAGWNTRDKELRQ